MAMEDRIRELRARMEDALAKAENKEKLAEVWQNYLSKKGQVADLMKGLGSLSPEAWVQTERGKSEARGVEFTQRRHQTQQHKGVLAA